MEFNSLDAQREACEAYIASQKHEGWIMLPDDYDDGGFTGGNMDRPALKRLVSDIKNGLIDTVVVYKVDRLSRSLGDFAKLIDLFDEHKVSFVSVTQQFNTTTSMGRLTLNILLSFAQFEREVIGERIRDKFAASKRKGMWMGGVTPMGYEVRDRQLHINKEEAKAVKAIFEHFVMLRSVTILARELPAMGILSKKRMAKNGREFGGTPLDKGAIYKILNNPIYIGKIRHKEKIYDGRHEAIISDDLWERAHNTMQQSPRERAVSTKRRTKAVLCGVLRCGGCNSSMTPCHTKKKGGKLYRYYGAVNYKKGGCPDCPIKQVTANSRFEECIMELSEFLRQTQQEVRAEIDEQLSSPGSAYPYPESVFSEIVMQHMSEIGMTFEPVVCHYTAKVGNANLRLSGYAVSDDADQIDLFVSLYDGVDEIKPVPDADTKTAAEQCLRFLAKCANGSLLSTMDKSNDAYALALNIKECYPSLDQIRVYVLTDRQAKAKNFKPREVNGKTVKLEVMDIERLHRHWSEGKPRDELVVNFEEVSGGALPCVYVPGEAEGYDYAMTVIPGEALRFIYEK